MGIDGAYRCVPKGMVTVDRWTHAPFSGEVADNQIGGRGAARGKAITILEAAEDLLRHGFKPERTIYISLGHDEEVIGSGAKTISNWFAQNNIHPELVLDEGGEITLEQFPGLNRPIAAIGVAEKGFLSFQLSVEKPGGHSSMPEKETAIDILTRAVVNLRKEQMPYHVTAPMASLLERVGPGLSFKERMAISNQWLSAIYSE
jgi:carboxypeptidase PM20D1